MTEPLVLEPSPAANGEVPAAVITELRVQYADHKDSGAALSEAIKLQAEKYGVKPGALRRYIAALEQDSVEDVEAECKDLERLIG